MLQHVFRLGLVMIILVSQITLYQAQGTILSVPSSYPTIQAAIDAANSGDTIIVESGLYQESLFIDKALTLMAGNFDPDNPVNNSTIIQGSSSGLAPYTIRIESNIVGEVTVRGFVITNGNDGISAASQISVEYNYFYSGNDLIDTELGAGGIIRGNVFLNAGDDAIDIDDAIYPLSIESNRIYGSHDDGLEIRLQNASAPLQPIDILIENNQFIGNNRTAIQFIDYTADPQDTNRRFTIFRNLFVRSGIAAIGFMPNEITQEDLSGADIVESVFTYNNTFYDNYYALSGGDNHVAFNNIIVQSNVGAWRVAGSSGDDSIAAYTLFFNNVTDDLESSLGQGNIYNQAPFFVYPPDSGLDGIWNTPDDDYMGLALATDSPAIDAGVTFYHAVSNENVPNPPIADYNGTAPDLGWRESNPTPIATPSTTATETTVETTTPIIVSTQTATSISMASDTPVMTEPPTQISATSINIVSDTPVMIEPPTQISATSINIASDTPAVTEPSTQTSAWITQQPIPIVGISVPVLTMSVEHPFALPGDTVAWLIQISNPNTDPVFNISVIDEMPAEVVIHSVSATGGTVSFVSQTITWSIGQLNPQETITITIMSHIKSDVVLPFIITNNARLYVNNAHTVEASTQILSVSELPLTGESPWLIVHDILLVSTIASIWVFGSRVMWKKRDDNNTNNV